ncbi:MAG: NADH-quinone oxidoreductase subunit L [Candidatus Rokubacteria bacterium]|nr:NADH-quinone oxidoreductase subunit L [Candidatus Rokubacteria bacterium]
MPDGPAAFALVALWLPFGAFVLLSAIPPLRRTGRLAGRLSILAVAGSLAAAILYWRSLVVPYELRWAWLPAADGPLATVGLLLDATSAAMLVLVALVSFLVQLYSLGYLEHESAPALGRYYAYQSLFAFSMMGLVLASNFLQMFIFWELVGLCSYLLIGFWYARPEVARAAVKAFWTTKAGDLGFIIGIVLLWNQSGTFDFTRLFSMARDGSLASDGLGLIMFLIYLGAVGKSAQFPLHVWLPDAMEGPTPVSALIHAATMVAAGVYLVTRVYPLFLLTPEVLTLIAWVGAFTALLAATLALVQADIKRVLAYSTVSQLGYMMAALGAGALGAGFFHLLTHGVFKALLFLGAGAAIHAVGSNDVFRMGRLARVMPQTAIVFVVGTLALSGVPPFVGYFSKEAVLAGVWEGGQMLPFLMLTLTVFLTAFYMFRVVFLAFFGARRADGHPHDPPLVMAGPNWLLAGLSLGLGIAVWLGMKFPAASEMPHAPGWLAALSLALALGGIAFAWLTYQRRLISPEALAAAFGPFRRAAERKYWLDDLYEATYRGVILALSWLIGWVDRYLVDGMVNVMSAWTLRWGDRLRMIQTGQAQDYLYGVAFGLVIVIIWSQWR